MMSAIDYRPEPDEIEDPEFEAELRARTRRRWIGMGVALAAIGATLLTPWRESVDMSGRVAPARWARVRSEVSGVVRELKRRPGDVLQAGDIIAVLDSNEQRDALEGARLALTRERQKLADLELRVRENGILSVGANVAVQEAEQRAQSADRIEGTRFAALDPAATAVLEGVRSFTIKARGQLAIDGRRAAPLRGEPMLAEILAGMTDYVERAEAVAEHVSSGAGEDAARELRGRLDNARFTFALAESSMREILLKHEVVVRGLLAPGDLRQLVDQLERESRDLGQGFAGVALVARGLTGSPTERQEWVRSAEERRELLANEKARVEAERETVESSIAQAELVVHAAERHEGKTTIHAPISGVLSETTLAELDGVGAHTSVGVIEDMDQVVLKVHVPETEWLRVAEGQPVKADVGGRTLAGTVAWKVPRAGQEVRDQEWNLLVNVDGDVTGVETGAKVEGSVAVGQRSLLRRWLDWKGSGPAPLARVAFVDDPTELRASGTVDALAATDADATGVAGRTADN